MAENMRLRALQSRDAIELLADKWRIPILHVLAPGALRSSELQKAISEISPKVLTQTLRRMERDGLLMRKVYPVVPPKVEYQLTNMGRSLLEPLRQLCLWAKSHVRERDRARHDFEKTNPARREPKR
jgi:DNA-binding HxlR family transcriptional regulator